MRVEPDGKGLELDLHPCILIILLGPLFEDAGCTSVANGVLTGEGCRCLAPGSLRLGTVLLS